MFDFSLIVPLVLWIVIMYFILKGVIVVPQQHVMVIETLGKYSKTLQAGMNIVIPFLEQPRSIAITQKQKMKNGKIKSVVTMSKLIDLREIVTDFDLNKIRTKDEQYISVKVLLGYQVIKPEMAVYSVKNLPESLEKLVNTTLRNIISQKFLSDTLSFPETICEDLLSILEKETADWGVQVKRVKIHKIMEK